MTPDQIGLVKQSYYLIAPVSHQAAGLFYGRLFSIAPEVKPLFDRANMFTQSDKLWATLGKIVDVLDRPEALGPAAAKLAVSHVHYGVMPEHYAPVGDALVWALEQGLGESFNPEVRDAWTAAYDHISQAMISATNAAVRNAGAEAAAGE